MQIWDTAGQEKYRTLTTAYYKGAQGIIMAYDCTYTESFENVSKWVKQIENHASSDVKKILLGNKCDLVDKKLISKEQGEDLAKKLNM